MPGQVGESLLLVLLGSVVDVAERARLELAADADSQLMPHQGIGVTTLAQESDRLVDDVVGREKQLRQPPAAIAREDRLDALVVDVALHEEPEEEARVEEDQSVGSS